MTDFDDLDTPALLLDLDLFERNMARIIDTCAAQGVGWRPHAKAHKCVEIARLQLARRAIGITCAKLGEAEVMAGAGIHGILIANQIVGRHKIGRLRRLLETSDPIVCADDPVNVAELAAAMVDAARPLRVAIEVDIGMHRAGVEPGRVVGLAKHIAAFPSLRFAGVVGWESHAVALADPDVKRATVAAALAELTASAQACRAAGIPVAIVSCGGTGTFPYCVGQPGVTEVQVGGAVFGDLHYRDHFHVDFDLALSLLATVVSRPTPSRIILDAGKKAMSGDAALPQPIGLDAVAAVRLSAEHCTVELARPCSAPRVGDRVRFHVGYSDTTVHLHEEIVAVRGGAVVDRWPVAARGRTK